MVCCGAVELGVGEGRWVFERFEVLEDRCPLQNRAQVVLDLLDEIVAALDGPVTGDEDVDRDEGAGAGAGAA